MNVLCDNYHTLLQHLVSSIFRKIKKEKQDKKVWVRNKMTLYKKLEWKKDKFTVLASDRNQEIVKYERRIDYENNGQNNLNEEERVWSKLVPDGSCQLL